MATLTKQGLCFWLLTLLACQLNAAEQRKRFDVKTPLWMQNIAALEVPSLRFEDGRARHYIEYCSGTLLHDVETSQPRYILSAWHCVEHYHDLSQALRVRFPHLGDGNAVYKARLMDSGGRIDRDWALLELSASIPEQQLSGLPLIASDPEKPATAAGFALALEQGKNRLSFDDTCQTQDSISWEHCVTSKGASGGPLVQTLDGTTGIVGVISQGDSQTLTISFPSTRLPQRWRQRLTL